jgi:hypothetical protein
MKMVIVFERYFGLIADDLIVAVTLQEKNVLQWNAREVFQVCARLNRMIQLEPALIDENVNVFVMLHCRIPYSLFRVAELYVSEAVKKCAIMAVWIAPPEWLRHGWPQTQ